MFFSRLRRHAKWVFVLLALVFASASWSSAWATAARSATCPRQQRLLGGSRPSTTLVRRSRRTRRAPQGSASSRRRSRTTASRRGARHRSRSYVAAAPERHRRAARARRPLPRAARTRSPQEPIAQLRASDRTSRLDLRRPLASATAPALGTDPIDEALTTQANAGAQRPPSRKCAAAYQKRESLRAARRRSPRRDPTSSSSSPRRRRGGNDVPTAIAAYKRS